MVDWSEALSVLQSDLFAARRNLLNVKGEMSVCCQKSNVYVICASACPKFTLVERLSVKTLLFVCAECWTWLVTSWARLRTGNTTWKHGCRLPRLEPGERCGQILNDHVVEK